VGDSSAHLQQLCDPLCYSKFRTLQRDLTLKAAM
jgi:hypothetical protein